MDNANLTASFEVKCYTKNNVDTVQLIIHGKTIVSSKIDPTCSLYERLFNGIKTNLINKSPKDNTTKTTKDSKKGKKQVKKIKPEKVNNKPPKENIDNWPF